MLQQTIAMRGRSLIFAVTHYCSVQKPCFCCNSRLQCVAQVSFLLQHIVAVCCRSPPLAATHGCIVLYTSPFCCQRKHTVVMCCRSLLFAVFHHRHSQFCCSAQLAFGTWLTWVRYRYKFWTECIQPQRYFISMKRDPCDMKRDHIHVRGDQLTALIQFTTHQSRWRDP